MQTIKSLTLLFVALLLTSCATTGAASDSESDHEKVEAAYGEAIGDEEQRVSEPAPVAADEEAQAAEKLGVHMGFALRRGAVNDLVKTQLKAELIRLVSGADGSFSVAGKEIPLGIDSQLVDLEINADEACDTCLRVSGKLAGKVDFDLPLTKKKSEDDYESKFSLVAPLQFVRGPDGGALLRLDTAQIARLGGLFVETKIDGLPSKVQPLLRKGLDKAFSEALLSKFKPVDLVTVPTLPLGVEGLEVLPSALSLETETNTLFMGIATNLPGIDGDIDQIDRLGDTDAAAVGIHLQVLAHAITLKMRSGDVARRYDLDGAASPDGSAHVVVRGLRPKPSTDPDEPSELVLDFDVFSFGDGAPAFTTSGSAHIRAPKGGEGAYVERIEFAGGDEGVDPENWKQAGFLDATCNLVDKLTERHGIDVASRNLFVGTHRVQVGARSLTAFAGASRE